MVTAAVCPSASRLYISSFCLVSAMPQQEIDRDSLTESEKWKTVADNAIKLNSVGFLCGTALSMVLFKSTVARAACSAFGAGVGCGVAYVDARYLFGHDVVADRAWIASVTAKPS